MFNVHRVGSNSISVKNLILLFFTIVFGFASVITLAQIDILSTIDNSWQTIGRVTITSDGTNSGTKVFDFNYNGSGNTFISGLQDVGIFSGKVLGIDSSGNLIYIYSNNLVVSGTGGTTTTVITGSDDDWMIAGNDIYSIPPGNVGIGTQTMSGKLHITSAGATEIYLEETLQDSAASLRLQTPARTWIAGGDSNPDVFFIGVMVGGTSHQEYFTINPLGNIGIGTITPQEKLEVTDGNIRISNLQNKVVLGTNASGTIIASTSGSIYNLISGLLLSGPAGPQGATGAQGATGPAGIGTGDNLGNHIATLNLDMMGFGIRKIGSGAGLLQNCTVAEKGTVKFENNCFQGCDGTTRLVLGGTCTGLPIVCGDGNTEGGETCDDGNTANNDGCSSVCQRETQTGSCSSLPANTVANTVTQITQTCAASNTSICTSWIPSSLTPVYSGTASTTACQYKCTTGYTWSGSISTCVLNIACGNGTVQGGETCDDGNTANNDGCSSVCQRETQTGSCSSLPANTVANTVTQITQTCASSNGTNCLSWLPSNLTPVYNITASTTACQYKCTTGYTWSGSISTCVLPAAVCGDNITGGTEQCDYGDTANNDGCSSTCQRETPICNFTFAPSSGTVPLLVDFSGTNQTRAKYSLTFGDGDSALGISELSGLTHTYITSAKFVPELTVINKLNNSNSVSCYATGAITEITVVSSSTACGRGLSIRGGSSCSRGL